MTLRIVFCTHQTSEDNLAGLASGHCDTPLSDLGREQAAERREEMRDEHFDAAFCSDLVRATETATIVLEGRGIAAVADSRLRELDYGELTHRPVPEVLGQALEHVDVPYPGGESYVDATERMRAFLDETAARLGDARVLLIGHRATHHALEHLCLRLPLVEAVAAEFVWQPMWEFEYPPREEAAG